MTVALLDSDIIPYELGFVFDETVPEGKVLRSVDEKINSIQKKSGCTETICFLTHSKSNFRLHRATVAPYKGTRAHEKPYHWKTIRDYIESEYNAIEARGLEADDLIGTAHIDNPDSVICSRDKDMDTIPGWHYRWQCGERQPERKYHVSQFDGWYFFYYQLLIGDIVDNIKGVYGIGAKKAEKILANCSTKDEMHEVVKQVYINVYGDGLDKPVYYEDHLKNRYWRKPTEIMAEMADLLYIGVNRDYLERFEE